MNRTWRRCLIAWNLIWLVYIAALCLIYRQHVQGTTVTHPDRSTKFIVGVAVSASFLCALTVMTCACYQRARKRYLPRTLSQYSVHDETETPTDQHNTNTTTTGGSTAPPVNTRPNYSTRFGVPGHTASCNCTACKEFRDELYRQVSPGSVHSNSTPSAQSDPSTNRPPRVDVAGDRPEAPLLDGSHGTFCNCTYCDSVRDRVAAATGTSRRGVGVTLSTTNLPPRSTSAPVSGGLPGRRPIYTATPYRPIRRDMQSPEPSVTPVHPTCPSAPRVQTTEPSTPPVYPADLSEPPVYPTEPSAPPSDRVPSPPPPSYHEVVSGGEVEPPPPLYT